MLPHCVIRLARDDALIVVAALLAALAPHDAFAQAPAAQPSSPPADAYFPEPEFISNPVNRAINLFGEGDDTQKNGFYPEFSNMNTGAGWISVGPGYRRYVFNDRVVLDGSAAVSWHLYTMLQGRIEAPSLFDDRLTAGVQSMWQDQTQVNYFGPGPDSLEEDRSQYRLTETDTVGYATYHATDKIDVDGGFGLLYHPNPDSASGTFKPDLPNTLVLFAGQPGTVGPQPNFLHGEAALTYDSRDHKNHPTSGSLYRAALTSYWDQGSGVSGDFSYREYQAEGLRIVPITGKRWLLALRGWLVLTGIPSGNEIPIYLQPSIGGNNTLRSYHSYRFHGDNALTVNAESRWAIFEHVDLAAFVDAGDVGGSFSDLNLDKRSYGGGVRLHSTKLTLARADVAWGGDGWAVWVRTTDPLRLGRISRRIADVPFAP